MKRHEGSQARCRLHFNKLQGEANWAITFIIRSVGVIVVKVEVRRNVTGGVCSEAQEEW